MEDNEITIINNKIFKYNKYYDRLETEDNISPSIACPKCKNTLFQISYETYQCNANCKCGHIMEIYGG